MNDQRVKTDNEVIAEFMGWERYSQNSFKCPNTYPIHNNTSNGWTTFSADQLEFGSRWDWLMPAIQRAKESIKEAGWGTPTEKEAWSRLRMCLNEVSNINIQNAHYCLVKYIHWYQKQKSS